MESVVAGRCARAGAAAMATERRASSAYFMVLRLGGYSIGSESLGITSESLPIGVEVVKIKCWKGLGRYHTRDLPTGGAQSE